MLADVVPSGSVLAIRDGSTVAAGAWAFREPYGTVTLVADTTGPDEPGGSAVVAATLAASLNSLADARVTATLLDGHDTDPFLGPVVRTLPPMRADPALLVEIPPIIG